MIRDIKSGNKLLIAVGLILSLFLIYFLFRISVPSKLNLQVGDLVTEDIVATRAVVDHRATEKIANEQALRLEPVLVRSAELSLSSLERVNKFLDLVDTRRVLLYKTVSSEQRAEATTQGNDNRTATPSVSAQKLRMPTGDEIRVQAQGLVDRVESAYSASLNVTEVVNVLSMSESVYNTFREKMLSVADLVMKGNHDSLSLAVTITSTVNDIVAANAYYKSELNLIASFLRQFLQPNMVYDEQATELARQQIIMQAKANPILLPAGSRIALSGEKLSEVQLQQLKDLGLVDSGETDWTTLLSLLVLYLLILMMLVLYFGTYEKKQFRNRRDLGIALISILATLFLSAYLIRISPLFVPVYFLAVVLTAYFGLRTSLVLCSMVIWLLYPLTSMNSQFLFVAIVGTWAASLITSSQKKNRNTALQIVGTTFVCFVASMLYSLMIQANTGQLFEDAGRVTLSAALSAILAIGLQPIYELFVSEISPVKLIHLSEPSQPLLRKLFLEAPGTYQHSMMVANLAEAGAERIGADALLVRVGAYYHDIGKTWNPQMFTENQQGFNPHSLLNTEESVRVIFRHVTAGEEIARKNRLPQEIIDFISTHHGTTVLSYFYSQACEEAKAHGLPLPDPKQFTYPGRKPNSRETGLVMLADTTEAAMKSSGITHLDQAEELIRKLVRTKIDQDQLVESGLSFFEVEEVIQAFLQVYAGQFHERIKYPDANPLSQSTK